VYPFGVFISRVQPPHKAHVATIRKALGAADRVAILIGSCRQAPSMRNPFSFEQRAEMLASCFTEDERHRLRFFPLRDFPYSNTGWQVEVQRTLAEFTADAPIPRSKWNESVALFGHDKDSSTYYLNMFPQLTFVDTGWDAEIGKVNATQVRASYFEGRQDFWDYVPQPVGDWLLRFMGTRGYTSLVEEHAFIQRFKDSWKAAPYAPTFNTADAVVMVSGHVLLVVRGGFPGKGLYALPGGYVNPDETLVECALRELKEETGLKVERKRLLGGLQVQHTFDHPSRSDRGRVITEAFGIRLEDSRDRMLPPIRSKGGDDARGALWMPLYECHRQPEKFFEDHLDIITHFQDKLEEKDPFTFRAETTR
jgi:bifunctional NMN adenylyltransferase/nudix hydrolase